MTRGPVFPAFLIEREIAGEPIATLKALYPRHLWPDHWHDDSQPVDQAVSSDPDYEAKKQLAIRGLRNQEGSP
jgi:hypothetical protein